MKISNWSRIDLRWYLGVPCRKCQLPILFARDHTEASEELQRRPTGKLVLTCTLDECNYRADYTDSPVFRFKKPQNLVNPNKGNKEGSRN